MKHLKLFEEYDEAKDQYKWYIEKDDENGDETIVAKYTTFDKEEIQKEFDKFADELKDGEELNFMKVNTDKSKVGDDYILTVVNKNGKLFKEVTKGEKTYHKRYKK